MDNVFLVANSVPNQYIDKVVTSIANDFFKSNGLIFYKSIRYIDHYPFSHYREIRLYSTDDLQIMISSDKKYTTDSDAKPLPGELEVTILPTSSNPNKIANAIQKKCTKLERK